MNARQPVGRLAVVLHSHMPQVLGHGVWPFGEQWLWEAIAESYLPVSDVIRGHAVTLGITPVLADQLEELSGPAGDRFEQWVADTREYCYGEDMAAFHEVGRDDLRDALEPQLASYRTAVRRFDDEFGRDLVAMLDALTASGVQLLGGPATHAVLPLLASDFGLDLQLATGIEKHARRFGAGGGIWLPECAFDRDLDAALARAGVDYFCVDQSAVHGDVALENLEPIATPDGPLALPIDWQTIKQVWTDAGFPSAGPYRSTFARTIHDLLPWDNSGAAWNPEAARAQAHAHADLFLRRLAARLEYYSGERGRPGTCVFAADTELFGHWWYEGPWWLEHVLEQAAGYDIELVTLDTVHADATPTDREITRSSWGRSKSLETWDSPKVAELCWTQRRAELDLERALARAATGDAPATGTNGEDEALATARAELLLLQSSDWAFMESEGRTDEYGMQRSTGHLAAFERALSRLLG